MKIKSIFFISLIFYAINISHIYVAWRLLEEGYLAHFIVYIAIFGIDKIITFAIMFKKYGLIKSNIIFIVLDIIQVGFIYYIFAQLKFSLNQAIATKLFGRLYPLLILDLIFFFGMRILDSSSQYHVVILAYVNFVLLVIFSGILNYIFYFYYEELVPLKLGLSIVFQSSYYFSISQTFLLSDSFGISLGYYQIIIIIGNILYILYITGKNQLNQLSNYLMHLHMNNYYIYQIEIVEHYQYDNGAIVSVLSYLNQITRVGLILGYYNYSLSCSNEIIFVNLVLALFFNFIFLANYLKSFIHYSFYEKLIYVCSKKEIQRAIIYLKQKQAYVKRYIIIYQYKIEFHKSNENPQNNDCLYYDLQKSVSQKMKNKKYQLIFLNGTANCECNCKLKSLAMEEEYIHEVNHFFIEYFLLHQYQEIIMCRLKNGLLFTEFTQKLFKNFQKIKKGYLDSMFLSITAYQKYLTQSMVFNPQIILYDLYE